MYEVFIESSAEKDLKKFQPDDYDRVMRHIIGLADNPKPAGCRKIVGSANDWRIRIGVFRVIYELDNKTKTVKVMRIKHRREAYR